MEFSYSEAAAVAEEMKNIAISVRNLFEDTADTVRNLSNNFESSSDQQSAGHALALYEEHKGHFDEFINQIIAHADKIIASSDVYSQTEGQIADEADNSFKVQG